MAILFSLGGSHLDFLPRGIGTEEYPRSIRVPAEIFDIGSILGQLSLFLAVS
jgi:hypothetical protein